MQIETLKSGYKKYKEHALYGRYITNKHISPILEKLKSKLEINQIGSSVNQAPIFSIQIGNGNKKVLMWSQMHGNESTTTKALFDILNLFLAKDSLATSILNECSLLIIPILNPDGAETYSRLNANDIDLNRDAQDLSQPESMVLRQVFENFKPDYCFNLHGQRTIFGAGKTNNPATISFLAPSQDEACNLTPNRKVAMEIISKMNINLQAQIPNQIGIYDDAFNINCVGDTFQSNLVPTILFEAGHYFNDYEREITREYVFQSMLVSLDYMATRNIDGNHYNAYFDIPKNEEIFYDIIIENAKIASISDTELMDIGILYKEALVNDKIEFMPKIELISDLKAYFAHKKIDAKGTIVESVNSEPLKEGYENDFVSINSENFSLKLK